MGNIYEVVLFWGHSKGKTWHMQAKTFDDAVEQTKARIQYWTDATKWSKEFQPAIFIESITYLFSLGD